MNEMYRDLEKAYKTERPKLLARLRAVGRTLEEAEDLVHDVYAETLRRMPFIGRIRSFTAFLNWLLKRRLIDAWRHDPGGMTRCEVIKVKQM